MVKKLQHMSVPHRRKNTAACSPLRKYENKSVERLFAADYFCYQNLFSRIANNACWAGRNPKESAKNDGCLGPEKAYIRMPPPCIKP
jgi:hypothetical protein